MAIESRKGIPALLQETVPEIGDVTAKASMDLYDFLKEVFVEGFLVPRLRSAEASESDVVRKCFRFVELLLASPVPSIRSAAAFQIIEPLFDDERLLLEAFPVMGEKALALAVDTLDADRISPAARSALRPYL